MEKLDQWKLSLGGREKNAFEREKPIRDGSIEISRKNGTWIEERRLATISRSSEQKRDGNDCAKARRAACSEEERGRADSKL